MSRDTDMKLKILQYEQEYDEYMKHSNLKNNGFDNIRYMNLRVCFTKEEVQILLECVEKNKIIPKKIREKMLVVNQEKEELVGECEKIRIKYNELCSRVYTIKSFIKCEILKK